MIGQRQPGRSAPCKWFKLLRGQDSLSLSQPMWVYSHVLFVLLINTLLVSLLSVSLWKFISTNPTGQGLVTGPCGLVASIQLSHCRGPTSISGQGNEILLKAAAGQGHPRSVPSVFSPVNKSSGLGRLWDFFCSEFWWLFLHRKDLKIHFCNCKIRCQNRS